LRRLQGGSVPAYYGLYSSEPPHQGTGPRFKYGINVMVQERLEHLKSPEDMLCDLADDMK
jgi:hypothetical protein